MWVSNAEPEGKSKELVVEQVELVKQLEEKVGTLETLLLVVMSTNRELKLKVDEMSVELDVTRKVKGGPPAEVAEMGDYGNVANYIHLDEEESCGLDWYQRYKIIKGICCALHYLHNECQSNISLIHLDLKPENILLDDNMVPKIADFGLAKLFDDKKSQIVTSSRVGSQGYMAPEYIFEGKISPMADIYSLGVIIVQLITGHNFGPSGTEVFSRDFVEPVLRNWRKRLEAAPRHTSLETDHQQIKNCLELGISCTEFERRKRPSIKEIIEMLNKWENTHFYASDEEKPHANKILRKPQDLLEITPHEVHFALDQDIRSPRFVKLTNKTDDYVAFYFWPTKKKNKCYIEPISGLLMPRSTFNVVVTIKGQEKPPDGLKCHDVFLIQSIPVWGYSAISKPITLDMFHNLQMDMVHKVKLTVQATSKSSLVTEINKPMEFLKVNPLQLDLSLEGNKYRPHVLKLINKYYEDVAFYIRVTKGRNKYRIEPSSGILLPYSTSNVTVTIEKQGKTQWGLLCKDELLIQSINVGLHLHHASPESITADFFEKKPSNMVDKAKLIVIYGPSDQELSQSSLLPEDTLDTLIMYICQDLGFSIGRPIAACVIYRCLLHWKIFEAERTVVCDHILQSMSSSVKSQDNSDILAYWLSNTSTLLLLLQQRLNTNGSGELTTEWHMSYAASLWNMFSEIRTSLQSAVHPLLVNLLVGEADDIQEVEAKNPALHFKEQLTDILGNIYRMIRDKLKKEMSPLIGVCIQAPRTFNASLLKASCSKENALERQNIMRNWQSIVKILTNYLFVLKANYVPSFLISKLFLQTFSFLNAQLFNSLLNRQECCSYSNGEYVKAGLIELEQWCTHATKEYIGSSWEELKHISQAVGFLVLHDKPNKTLKEITNDFCPVLSVPQLYKISTQYWDDKYSTLSVSCEVLTSMRDTMTELSSNAPLILDDDLSIPFSGDDVLKTMAEFEVTDVEIPPSIQENSAFAFLGQGKNQ